MLKKLRVIDVIAGIFIIAIFAYIALMYSVVVGSAREQYIDDYTEIVIEYIKENEGQLPDESFVISKLRYKKEYDLIVLRRPCIGKIEEKEGKLFDKETGEQVFIIKGKSKWSAKKVYTQFYEKATLRIYEEMLKYESVIEKSKEGVQKEFVLWIKKNWLLEDYGEDISGWVKYETSSQEGVVKVEGWVSKYINKLDVEPGARIPDKMIYYLEDGEVKYGHEILEWYSKERKPVDEREFVEHIPREEIEALMEMFNKYGSSREYDEGPYP